MPDFDTLTQLAVSPPVTLSLIAILSVTVILQSWGRMRQLRDQRIMFMNGITSLLSAISLSATQEIHRRERLAADRAIAFTYAALKNIGWDKLARGYAFTFDDIIFGTPGPVARDPYAGLADEINKGGDDNAGGTRAKNTDSTLSAKYGAGGDAAGLEGNGGISRGEETSGIRKGPRPPRPFHFTGGDRS